MGSPKIPQPTVPSAPAQVEDPAVQQAAAEAARRRTMSRGYRSTVLSNLMQMQGAQQRLGSTLGS